MAFYVLFALLALCSGQSCTVSTFSGSCAIGFVDGVAAAASFNGLNEIVLSEGNIYAADTYNVAVRVISPQGDVSTLVSGGGTFFGVWGVAALANGSTLVTSSGWNRISRYHLGSTTTFSSDALGPWFLVVYPNGDIGVSEYIGGSTNRVSRGTENAQVGGMRRGATSFTHAARP